MPDKKGKRSSKSGSKSSRTVRRSHDHDQSGEMPRDQAVDSQLFQELYALVLQRSQLRGQFEGLVAQLSTRRAGIQTAEALYSIFINMDFTLIRGLSSSASAARERRGVRHRSQKKRQTEEIDTQMHFYQELNQAAAMQRGIEAIPQSLAQFTADEQAIVRNLADMQGNLGRIDQRIRELQTWLRFLINQDLEPSDFISFGGDDGDDGDDGCGGYGGYALETGENVAQ